MPHQCTDCGATFADGSTEMLSGCPDCGGNTFQYLPEGAAEAGVTDPADLESSPPPEADQPGPSTGDSVARTVGNAARTLKNVVGTDTEGPGTSPEAADPLAPWPEDERDGDAIDAQPPAGDRTKPAGDRTKPAGDRTKPAGDRTKPAGDRTKPADRPQRSRRSRPADSPAASGEDAAQASARSTVVGPEELPAAGRAEVAAGTVPPSGPSSSGESSPEDRPSDPADGDGQTDPEADRPDLETLREELNDQFESIRIVEPGQYELNLMELYEREEYVIALQEDGRYRIQVPESWRE